MRITLGVAFALALAGCGRVGFDPFGPGAGGDDTTMNDGGGGGSDGASGGGDGGMGASQWVQGGVTGGSGPSIVVSLTSPLQANDVIVLAAGFRDATSAIVSVTDSNSTTYTQQGVPRTSGSAVSQTMYTGFSAAAASATITVLFSGAVPNGSVRVAVYRGIDINGGIGTGGASVAGASSCTASAFVPSIGDLIVTACIADVAATGPGPGFTMRSLSSFGDLIQDKTSTMTGLQSVTAPLSSGGASIMQLITLPPL